MQRVQTCITFHFIGAMPLSIGSPIPPLPLTWPLPLPFWDLVWSSLFCLWFRGWDELAIALKTYSTSPAPVAPITPSRDPTPSRLTPPRPTPPRAATPTGLKPLLSLRARSEEERLCKSGDDNDDDKSDDDGDNDDNVSDGEMFDLEWRSTSVWSQPGLYCSMLSRKIGRICHHGYYRRVR